jgi:hypothetical protein
MTEWRVVMTGARSPMGVTNGFAHLAFEVFDDVPGQRRLPIYAGERTQAVAVKVWKLRDS